MNCDHDFRPFPEPNGALQACVKCGEILPVDHRHTWSDMTGVSDDHPIYVCTGCGEVLHRSLKETDV